MSWSSEGPRKDREGGQGTRGILVSIMGEKNQSGWLKGLKRAGCLRVCEGLASPGWEVHVMLQSVSRRRD